MRLIDADALEESLVTATLEEEMKEITSCYCYPCRKIIEAIDNAPTIEAVPVVHGRWVPDERGVYYCSACNSEAYWTEYGQQLFKHCQECGADMRKGGA